MSVLTDYLEQSMIQACLEKMEDGRYFGRIDGIPGPWADGDTPEECRARLREVFEEWLVAALRDDEELPVLGGISLNFGGRRWSAPLPVAKSSAD